MKLTNRAVHILWNVGIDPSDKQAVKDFVLSGRARMAYGCGKLTIKELCKYTGIPLRSPGEINCPHCGGIIKITSYPAANAPTFSPGGPDFGRGQRAGKLAYEEAIKRATEEVERQKQLEDKRLADALEAESRRKADQPKERP